MGRLLSVVVAAAVAGAGVGGVALAQKFTPVFTPPADAEMAINLYPITKYRGIPEVITRDTPRIRRPISAESFIVLRGVWQLCPGFNYEGRCTTVSETRQGIPTPLQVRSARLVGDNGPTYADLPGPRGGLKNMTPAPMSEPAPLVAPSVAAGGATGENPSLKGDGVEFFAAPARDGVRVLACATGKLSPRCAEATANAFCAEKGYADSAMRSTQTVGSQTYLSNVLCKVGDANPGSNGDVKEKRRLLPFGR